MSTTTSRRRWLCGLVALSVALALVQMGVATAATAKTYYVSPAGRDSNPGTITAPFKTITYGMKKVRPGDTLLVRGGRYAERVLPGTIAAGTATAPIRVAAYPSEHPVVEGVLWLRSASHWTVDGINVTWGSLSETNDQLVKLTDGTGWRFTNAEVWGAHSTAAILVAGSPVGFQLDHLYVHDTYATNGPNHDSLLYISSGSGGGIIERNVLAGSVNGRAVKLAGGDNTKPAVKNVIVRYNTMYNNLGPSAVLLAWGASNNQIYRNIMVLSKDGRANVSGYELTGTNNVVRDNVGWLSDGVLDALPGLVDAGGNVMTDPSFANPSAGDFRVLADSISGYGAAAV
jgi:hypothetical protein